MSKVIVIGGGATGMMAAIGAAYNGNTVELLEKNDRLGKKIFITGSVPRKGILLSKFCTTALLSPPIKIVSPSFIFTVVSILLPILEPPSELYVPPSEDIFSCSLFFNLKLLTSIITFKNIIPF